MCTGSPPVTASVVSGEHSPEIVWGVAERGTRVVYDPGPVDRQLQ